jgi:hypothetical protein
MLKIGVEMFFLAHVDLASFLFLGLLFLQNGGLVFSWEFCCLEIDF